MGGDTKTCTGGFAGQGVWVWQERGMVRDMERGIGRGMGGGAWGGVCWYVSTDLYVSLKTA